MLNILRRLFPQNYSFKDYESWVIRAVENELAEPARETLRRQLECFNSIQRLADDKEVDLYCMRNGKPHLNNELRFPDTREEALLATVTAKHPSRRERIKAEVWIVNGHLFSINFNKPPGKFFADLEVTKLTSSDAEVKVWFDPMAPPIAATAEPGDPAKLTGWVRDWHSRGLIGGFNAPLSPDQRRAALERVDASLPDDYLELVAQADEAQVGRWKVHGPSGIRSVVLTDANYYILAETDGRVLGVQGESTDKAMYEFDLETDEAQPAGTSIRDALLPAGGRQQR